MNERLFTPPSTIRLVKIRSAGALQLPSLLKSIQASILPMPVPVPETVICTGMEPPIMTGAKKTTPSSSESPLAEGVASDAPVTVDPR